MGMEFQNDDDDEERTCRPNYIHRVTSPIYSTIIQRMGSGDRQHEPWFELRLVCQATCRSQWCWRKLCKSTPKWFEGISFGKPMRHSVGGLGVLCLTPSKDEIRRVTRRNVGSGRREDVSCPKGMWMFRKGSLATTSYWNGLWQALAEWAGKGWRMISLKSFIILLVAVVFLVVIVVVSK